jgi:hypothetical protein
MKLGEVDFSRGLTYSSPVQKTMLLYERGSCPMNCFVISPIGQEGSEIRKHANEVFKFIIKPAMDACKIEPLRSDQLNEPGKISEQMFNCILTYDLCVAVLTHHNPNVFYELAVAQSACRPVILLIEKGQALPFDIQDLRCVQYDLEIESYQDQRYINLIIEHVRNLEARGWEVPALYSNNSKESRFRYTPFARNTVEETVDNVLKQISSIKTVLPLGELLPKLRRLFDRATYSEPILDCGMGEWNARLRANILNERVLRHFQPSVDALGSDGQKETYGALINALNSHSNYLFGLFSSVLKLKRKDISNTDMENKAIFDQALKPYCRDAREMFATQGDDRRKVVDCELSLLDISRLWVRLGQSSPMAVNIIKKSLNRLHESHAISDSSYDELCEHFSRF